MNSTNKIDLSEELDNTTTENVTDNATTDGSISDITDDAVALAYDYYDKYYENIQNKLDMVVIKEDKMIENQDKIIAQNDTFTSLGYTIIFFLALIFIYNVLRNAINVK